VCFLELGVIWLFLFDCKGYSGQYECIYKQIEIGLLTDYTTY